MYNSKFDCLVYDRDVVHKGHQALSPPQRRKGYRFFSGGEDPLSNVTTSFQGWGTLGTRLAMYLLCTCTHFAQRIYIRSVCTSTEERASSLLLTRKPTPFAPSCLRDTIVHYYFFTFCVSYLGDYNHRSRKYFSNIIYSFYTLHFFSF